MVVVAVVVVVDSDILIQCSLKFISTGNKWCWKSQVERAATSVRRNKNSAQTLNCSCDE